MRDVCRSQRLLYVDTLGELSRRQHSGQTLFFTHDPHPTPQGHIAVAEMLARTISEDNLMPAKYVLDARNLNATPSPPDGSSVTR
jgi:phospholipase/lecithinase/hemolysin